MEYWVIDRWEGDVAVCQNDQGNIQEIPKSRFPETMKEGEYFRILENGDILPSSNTTKKRREIAKKLRKRLLLR